MKLGSVFMSWTLYLSPVMLWAALTLLAANLETLQCDGPISTRESSCHTDADPRDDDYEIKAYTFSEPFHLIVSYDWLILQSPSNHLFEGDPLVLRCRAWQDWPLTQVTFYRDGSALGPPGPNKDFSIAAVQKADSGRYHCSGVFRSPGPGSPETAAAVAITVQAPSGSAAPPTLNPAPQKSAAPETTPTEPPGPPPPQPTPASEDSGFSSPLRAPDPHLYHRMGLLLQHIQDVRALLGHLVIELRDLSGHLKPGATKAPAK
ncbi:Fc receptor-like A isoform X3 [Lepus europaeus]|uniref:Fc receptor-like A isoform X3 n=1 Tax=Lepus europaeus TaxID=9983 RepID=UPI002B4A296D|nr:Fc receptor-like A isoform X3 [Lepus europaeus]